MSYKLSKSSKKKLDTCCIELQLIVNKALEISPIDFGVSEGYRTLERQQELFKQGFSGIDGINKKGYHNYKPSRAIDLYAYVDGKANYQHKYMGMLAGVMLSIAKDMGIDLEWGGDWTSLVDMPHYQIKIKG